MRLVEKLRRIAAPVPTPPPPRGGGAGLPGEQSEGEFGPFWVRRKKLPLDHRHGRVSLRALRETQVSALAGVARDERLRDADFSRALFFDTETTSLGGGVGTYVFLLGAGFFERDAFVVEQYFLREVTQERALLHAINARFKAFELVVSFHGKGFDAPRLSGRLAFHRMPLAMPRTHLDLCLVGRSLFRGAFQDCRLQTFERELVRYERRDDLPGAECPRAFFSHLQGDSSVIPRVFEHNLLDVLTLPSMAARFAEEVSAPREPVVHANLGLHEESAGRDREARRHYLAALDGLRERRHPLMGRVLERLALLERRAGRHAASARLLHERVATPPHAFQPLEDLAKYYEHHAHDLPSAEATALDARSRLLSGKIAADHHARQRHLKALDHRIRRLRRRMDRTAQNP